MSGLSIGGTIISSVSPIVEKTLGMRSSGGYQPSQWHEGVNIGSALNGGLSGIMSAAMSALVQTVLVKTNIGGLMFDAIFSVDTEHSLTITQHPVQTGASMSDHAFVNPVRISMQIGMSDAMAYRKGMTYANLGPTKSISAYRMLCELQAARTPLDVVTRLNTYHNMLIESIAVSDDVSTANGLKATVGLVQVLVVDVATEKTSARNWTSGSGSKNGEQQPVAVEDESTLAKIKGDGGYYNKGAA